MMRLACWSFSVALCLLLISVGSRSSGQTVDPDAVIRGRIERVRQIASKIKIDGKADDWEGIPTFSDPEGDAGGDPSRDIVKTAIAPLENELLVLIATAGKPSKSNFAFGILWDFVGSPAPDAQIAIIDATAPAFLMFQGRSGLMVRAQNGTEIAINEVVEMRIPYDWAFRLLEPPNGALLRTENGRSWMRVTPFTYNLSTGRHVDLGAAAASFRLVRNLAVLDPPHPRVGQSAAPVEFPASGRWFLGQGPFAGHHRVAWGYDFSLVDQSLQPGAVGLSTVPGVVGITYLNIRNSTRNEDYYSFNQPVVAPQAARVIGIAKSFPDSVPFQKIVAENQGANAVHLDVGNNVDLVLGHLRQGSIVVNDGQAVIPGQLLGAVGSSGSEIGPQLHMGLRDVREYGKAVANPASYPLALSNVRVSLNHAPDDPWARDLTVWEPREGFFVE